MSELTIYIDTMIEEARAGTAGWTMKGLVEAVVRDYGEEFRKEARDYIIKDVSGIEDEATYYWKS